MGVRDDLLSRQSIQQPCLGRSGEGRGGERERERKGEERETVRWSEGKEREGGGEERGEKGGEDTYSESESELSIEEEGEGEGEGEEGEEEEGEEEEEEEEEREEGEGAYSEETEEDPFENQFSDDSDVSGCDVTHASKSELLTISPSQLPLSPSLPLPLSKEGAGLWVSLFPARMTAIRELLLSFCSIWPHFASLFLCQTCGVIEKAIDRAERSLKMEMNPSVSELPEVLWTIILDLVSDDRWPAKGIFSCDCTAILPVRNRLSSASVTSDSSYASSLFNRNCFSCFVVRIASRFPSPSARKVFTLLCSDENRRPTMWCHVNTLFSLRDEMDALVLEREKGGERRIGGEGERREEALREERERNLSQLKKRTENTSDDVPTIEDLEAFLSQKMKAKSGPSLSPPPSPSPSLLLPTLPTSSSSSSSSPSPSPSPSTLPTPSPSSTQGGIPYCKDRRTNQEGPAQ